MNRKMLFKLIEKSEKEGRKPVLHPDHAPPVSRRDFLSAGLAATSFRAFIPMGGLLASAWARADCPPIAGAPAWAVPCLLVDCAGGAGISGNIVTYGANGNYLESYSTMGLGSRRGMQSGDTDSTFGGEFWNPTVSRILAGMLETTDASTRSKVNFGTICNTSQDDSPGNEQNISHLINRLFVHANGVGGSLFNTGLAYTNGAGGDAFNGGRSATLLPDLKYKPVIAGSYAEMANSISFGTENGGPFEGVPQSVRNRMIAGLMGLSESQGARLYQSSTYGSSLRELFRCGFERALSWDQPGGGGLMDPRQDVHAQSVYGISAGRLATDSDVSEAGLTLALANGHAAIGTITVPGCDYHNGTRALGDSVDRTIGRIIGRALELHRRKGRPLMVVLFSDGSVYSPRGSDIWQGDDGGKSLWGLFYLSGQGQGRIPVVRRQIGAYVASATGTTGERQGVDQSGYFSNAKRAAYAAFLNYAAACGQYSAALEILGQVAQGDFSVSQAPNALIFPNQG